MDFNSILVQASVTARRITRKGARRNAIIAYIEELVNNLKDTSLTVTDKATALKAALNGADNWKHYSESGCSLCYNVDIAKLNFTEKGAKRALAHNNATDSMYLLHVQAARLRDAWWCVEGVLSF